MILRLMCLVIGYICGLLQTGYIVGKLKGIDIREYGSKNAGTTNILRTMGAKYAVIVLLGDGLKCGVAILVAYFLFKDNYRDILKLLFLYTASGVILGHNFPFYMGFKGGKGVAASAGFIIFGLGPVMALISLVVFVIVFNLTHYVSLGAICMYLGLVVGTLVFWKTDYFSFTEKGMGNLYIEYFVIICLLTILLLVRHKENIKRLVKGNERKTYIKQKPEISQNGRDE